MTLSYIYVRIYVYAIGYNIFRKTYFIIIKTDWLAWVNGHKDITYIGLQWRKEKY